jgi:hypothetical protein
VAIVTYLGVELWRERKAAQGAARKWPDTPA